LETPHGFIRLKAKLRESIYPQVDCPQHGWWQSFKQMKFPAMILSAMQAQT
jgi:hypothetical protein